MTAKLIEVKGLTIKDKKGNHLVNNLSLELHNHEFVGIMGESGSGKSLTTRAIMNTVPPGLTVTYDEMTLFGRSCKLMDEGTRRGLIGKSIGFIPQNTVSYLHPLIKIKNQIGDSYRIHFNKTKQEAYNRAVELLEKVGIKDTERVMNSYPFEISGGMKQRVNIAMALMTDPTMLIADEPTTALDTVTQKQVMDLFEKMNKEDGIPILFISHDLHLIKRYCQRLYVMYHGQIVETGNTDEVFNNPKHEYTKKLLASTLQLNREKVALH